jgi:hypothetical protein
MKLPTNQNDYGQIHNVGHIACLPSSRRLRKNVMDFFHNELGGILTRRTAAIQQRLTAVL